MSETLSMHDSETFENLLSNYLNIRFGQCLGAELAEIPMVKVLHGQKYFLFSFVLAIEVTKKVLMLGKSS